MYNWKYIKRPLPQGSGITISPGYHGNMVDPVAIQSLNLIPSPTIKATSSRLPSSSHLKEILTGDPRQFKTRLLRKKRINQNPRTAQP